MTHSSWPIVVFSLYTFVLFIFALIYYFIYRRKPESFLFHSEASRIQRQRFVSSQTDLLNSLTLEIGALDELSVYLHSSTHNLQSTTQLLEPVRFFQTPSYVYPVERRTVMVPKQSPTEWIDLKAISVNGEQVGHWNWDGLPVRMSLEQLVLQHIAYELPKIKAQKEKVLRNLQSEASQSAVMWSCWDFVYFSGITLTTVGYGDILPNRTLIRLLVLMEVMAGLLLLVVVVNLSVGPL